MRSDTGLSWLFVGVLMKLSRQLENLWIFSRMLQVSSFELFLEIAAAL